LNFNNIYANIDANPETLPQALLDKLPVACCCLETDGNLLACNKKWAALFGFESTQEALERSMSLLPDYQPSISDPFAAKTQVLLKESIAQALESGEARFRMLCAKNCGETFTADISLQREAPGLVIGCAVKLQTCETEKRMQIMLDCAPMAIFLYDENHLVTDCNQNAIALGGFKDKLDALNNYSRTLPPTQPDGADSKKVINASVEKAFLEGLSVSELMLQTVDGTPFPAEVTHVRVLYDGAYTVVEYTRDMREIKAAVEKEHEAYRQIQELVDASPFGINVWDENGNILRTSQQVVRMFGLESKAQFVENFFAFSPEYQPCGTLSAEKAQWCIKDALNTGCNRVEWMHQQLDGTPLPTEVTLVRLEEYGKPVLVAYITDLREIKAAMEKGHEAYRQTQAFIDAAPFVMNVWDENGNILRTSQQVVDMFGVESKEQFIQRFYEFSPKFQPNGKLSSEHVAEDTMRALRDGFAQFEWMHQQLDGTPLPTEVTLVRLEEYGKPIIVAYITDLRAVKAAMENEHEAYRQTQAFIDAAPFVINVWDENGRILRTSKNAIDMFGVESKEEFLRRFYDFSPEFQPSGRRSAEHVIENTTNALHNGFAQFEWMHQKLDGTPLPTEITLVRLEEHGKPIIVSYITDLSAVKAAMEKEMVAEEENRAKTRFLARMSHEIRTPMNAVLGITEIMLQKETHPPETEEAFLRIHSSSNLLISILNDILDLAKVEAGKMEIVPAPYEVSSMIVDTVQLNLMHLGSKAIDFALEVSEHLPVFLIGDELRIKQILNNLLSNAFKYTNEGQVTLSLDVEDAPQPGEITLVLRVTDTGQGMNKEQLNSLFAEFNRFNTENNRAIGGSGLGLHITRQLIDMMQGTVEVESSPERGTTFTVRITQKADTTYLLGKEAARNLQNLKITQKTLKKMSKLVREPLSYGRVLVVDDVESNLYVAKGILLPYKLSVETADSGQRAIDKIKAGNTYDVIFMDHMMPGMDGVETVKIMRGMGYELPIVALTANTVKGAADLFMNSGFSGFISKPIDIGHIDSYLMRFVRDKRIATEILGRGNECAALPQALARSFIRDAEKATHALEAICREEAPDSATLSAYITSAHAIKSALANINEPELSEFAAILEKTGREKHLPTLREKTPRFLARLHKIVEELSACKDEGIVGEDPANLQEQLLLIATTCENYDKVGYKRALSKLEEKGCSKQTRALLDEIAAHMLHGDFEEAAALAHIHAKPE